MYRNLYREYTPIDPWFKWYNSEVFHTYKAAVEYAKSFPDFYTHYVKTIEEPPFKPEDVR